ncbi:MAG TPA: hypothetical protein VF457_06060 [Burkholderiaceae bacterium]
MLIDVTEFFVVQIRARVAAEQTPEPWSDERSFDEDGPAFDRADYMREDGDTEARVVRRWR